MSKVLTTETNPGAATWSDAGTIAETQVLFNSVVQAAFDGSHVYNVAPLENILEGSATTSITVTASGTYILEIQVITIANVTA